MRQMKEICSAVQVIREDTVVYFVTHVLASGEQKFQVIKHNKNLMFAVRKFRRESFIDKVHTIALHHWCVKQRKSWQSVSQILLANHTMLLFLILMEVEKYA